MDIIKKYEGKNKIKIENKVSRINIFGYTLKFFIKS